MLSFFHTQDPSLSGHFGFFPRAQHQTQGTVSGISTPQGSTTDTNFPSGFKGYPCPTQSRRKKNTQRLFPNQPLKNQFVGRMFVRPFPGGKQDDQIQEFDPISCSPDQIDMPEQTLPFTPANNNPHQAQTPSTSAGGLCESATFHHSVPGVTNTVSGLNVVTNEGLAIKLTKGSIAMETVIYVYIYCTLKLFLSISICQVLLESSFAPTHTRKLVYACNRGPPIVPLLFILCCNSSYWFCTRFPTVDLSLKPWILLQSSFVICPRF